MSISTARNEQKQRTRTAIIEAAIGIFGARGLFVATTSEIAQAAGVAHGTVFVHFPTQELLLATAIEEVGLRIVRRIHELVDRGAGLRAILQAHLLALADYEDFYARLATEGASLHKTARDSLVAIQSAISFHVLQAAEAEMEAGKIRKMPLHLLFNTWIALVHYYLANRELFAPGASVIARRGRELLDHVLELYATDIDSRGGIE